MRFRHYDSLRCFVIAARHLHLGKAAAELNISKGAVSYQVRQLEAELGFAVFSRARRKLSLTQKGRELALIAQQMFGDFEQQLSLLGRTQLERITIGMATYFASRWLSPRLMHFITQNPKIGLRIQPLIDLTDLHSNELDLAIRWGKGEWRDREFEIELIFPCAARLTCSHALGLRIQAEGIEAVVRSEILLHDRDGSDAWLDWLQAAGIDRAPDSAGLVIRDPNVRAQAVIDGQGIALYDDLVDDEVAAGRLYQYPAVNLDAYGYFLIYPRGLHEQSAVMIFRDWIMREAGSR